MVNASQDERDQLISDFWESVRTKLLKYHNRKDDEIDLAIGQYRHAVEKKRIGDLLYHQGVDKTATVIYGIIEHGLPTMP
jgi:hypothetical protein